MYPMFSRLLCILHNEIIKNHLSIVQFDEMKKNSNFLKKTLAIVEKVFIMVSEKSKSTRLKLK